VISGAVISGMEGLDTGAEMTGASMLGAYRGAGIGPVEGDDIPKP